jgi:flagellin-like hook-associated protein FlgL
MAMGSPLFWPEVKAQAAAGLIVMAVGSTLAGVGYLIYTVPSRLDQVLSSQTEIKARMVQMENTDRNLERRVIILEAARGR